MKSIIQFLLVLVLPLIVALYQELITFLLILRLYKGSMHREEWMLHAVLVFHSFPNHCPGKTIINWDPKST